MLLTQKIHQLSLTPASASSTTSYPCTTTRVSIEASDDLEAFISNVERDFRAPLDISRLRQSALGLQDQFREKLDDSDICMLPSYSHALPRGDETGDYLAGDLGGSNFRIARVKLNGRKRGKHQASEVVRRWTFPIDDDVRSLEGLEFFDRMADQIFECLLEENENELREQAPFHVMGLSWSFPLDHKADDSVRLLQMGKNFRATEGLLGQDLGQLISSACRRQGIDIRVRGIINDGTASLLSQVYVDESTTMALILGTGLNAAVQLPAAAFSSRKLAMTAPPPCSGSAMPDILVNTELSMFGKNALSTTIWDELLKKDHPRPDFQPLEHLTSGRYLGEIVRLIIVQAITQSGFLDGEMPQHFGPYQLGTATLAAIEMDDSASMTSARWSMEDSHPLPIGRSYAFDDLKMMQRVILSVSDRAACYVATAVYSLWSLKQKSAPLSPATSDRVLASISCLGSIIGRYPKFGTRVQAWLDDLTADEDGHIRLQMTDEDEGALMGAAVAVALDQKEKVG